MFWKTLIFNHFLWQNIECFQFLSKKLLMLHENCIKIKMRHDKFYKTVFLFLLMTEKKFYHYLHVRVIAGGSSVIPYYIWVIPCEIYPTKFVSEKNMFCCVLYSKKSFRYGKLLSYWKCAFPSKHSEPVYSTSC